MNSRTPRVVDWLTALPDLGMAGFFLWVWIDPMRWSADTLGYLVLVLLLEFIVIHSSAFMGAAAVRGPGSSPLHRWGTTTAILILAAFYSLFILAFCFTFHRWWPIFAFWALTGNRLMGVLLAPGPGDLETGRRLTTGWAVSSATYLLGTMLTILLPLPRLGLTAAALARAALPGTGAWVAEPWRAMALGSIYFGVVGAHELVGGPRDVDPAP